MESIIFRHEGTLDKFLGDGVMVSFGTSDVREDGTQRALICVKEMVDVILPHGLSIAVGAHRGEVVLGDVESKRRLEFATIGDTVNVAARLEAATRQVGVRALVSDACITEAKTQETFEFFGPLELRGRKKLMNVWQIK